MLAYARRDLLRNPRRTLASLVGVVLGVGLFSGVLFFIDGSGASLTKRALAPVDIDVQRVLTSPLGEGVRLTQRLEAPRSLARGTRARMVLTVTNRGATPANEVLVKDRLAAALSYVPGSARRGGVSLRDVGGESPFSHGPGHIGHTEGTVEPGQTVRYSYLVTAQRAFDDAGRIPLRATLSTRETRRPQPSNAPPPLGVDTLATRIAAVPGVAAANTLAFVEVAPGSLGSDWARISRPVKIFGFDAAYARTYPTIRVDSGSFTEDGALLSPRAARELGVRRGAAVMLRLPGGGREISLKVSGIVDLSRARPLFNSREGDKLEDFLYVPDSIVISPRAFQSLVVPAFRSAQAARGSAGPIKSPPTLEVDVQMRRRPLAADPATALKQTRRIASDIKAIAPGHDFVLDNASNTLAVARADADVAKRMFLFLGLPGLLLAAFLSAYAGAILAAAQRREQATLRLRGAHRRHLTQILVYRTIALAGVGSLAGTIAGLLSSFAVLGASALSEAATAKIALSAAISIAAGAGATGLALYLPGRRALKREVSGERHVMATETSPAWRRWRLDYAAGLLVAIATGFALHAGAFDGQRGAVSTGQTTMLRSNLLALPIAAWWVGVLLSARLVEHICSHLPVAKAPRFGPTVRGLLGRTLSRRRRAVVTGLLGVGLVVAFGMGLGIFAATYDAAKTADARFTVGSDLRITPSPLSPHRHPAAFADRLKVGGVSSATPVVASLENAVLRSTFNSDVQDLVAIDPVGFAKTAALSDAFFRGRTARHALGALAAKPANILIEAGVADGLKLSVGDKAELVMARGTRHQRLRTVTVAGLFDRFPGFPEGVHVVANLSYYQAQTRTSDVDYFLARTSSSAPAGLTAATRAIQAGPGAGDRLDIDTTQTSLNRDQSSLTALNIRGLLDLNSFYTLAMSGAVVAIFVFGLMLQRRREYIALAAQGLAAWQLRALLLGEAAFVAATGLLAGLLAGLGLGLLLVKVLRPLFLLRPQATISLADGGVLAGLVILATLLSVGGGLWILGRLRPSEVLRET